MKLQKKWLRQFNDYSSLEFDNVPKNIYHYTKYENLINIIKEQCFRATRIQDFKDTNEGTASLKFLNKYVSEIEELDEQVKRDFCNATGTDSSTKKYIYKFPGYVVSFSTDNNSQYMTEQFNSNDKSAGRDCMIAIDKKKFINSASIDKLKSFNSHIFIGHSIVYDQNRQSEILNKEVERLWPLLEADECLDDKSRLDYLSRKIYYLGTYFKIPNKCIDGSSPRVSEQEKEFRIIVNLYNNSDVDMTEYMPKEYKSNNHQRYIEIHFDLSSVEYIMVPDESYKYVLQNNTAFKNIQIEVRDKHSEKFDVGI